MRGVYRGGWCFQRREAKRRNCVPRLRRRGSKRRGRRPTTRARPRQARRRTQGQAMAKPGEREEQEKITQGEGECTCSWITTGSSERSSNCKVAETFHLRQSMQHEEVVPEWRANRACKTRVAKGASGREKALDKRVRCRRDRTQSRRKKDRSSMQTRCRWCEGV